MDTEVIRRHLAQAEAHVGLGERHIEEQRARIAEMARNGQDTTEAVRLLAMFEQTQSLHVQDRDRLRNELASNTQP